MVLTWRRPTTARQASNVPQRKNRTPIILDVMMPGLNGFEVCKCLKKDKITKNILVVMLTSLAGEKDLSKGLEQGANCFITKPFNVADLLFEVKSAMGQS